MSESRWNKNEVPTENFQKLSELAYYPNDDGTLIGDECLFVPLVHFGLKTGGLGTFDGEKCDRVRALFSELGLYCEVNERSEYDHFGVLYSNNKELLNKVEFGVEDEDFGRFLGVPEQDNRWYEYNDNPNISDVKPIPEYLSLNTCDVEGLEYARLAPWICEPSIEGLQRTVCVCQEWYEVAEFLSKSHNYELGLEFAKQEMDRDEHPWYSFKNC